MFRGNESGAFTRFADGLGVRKTRETDRSPILRPTTPETVDHVTSFDLTTVRVSVPIRHGFFAWTLLLTRAHHVCTRIPTVRAVLERYLGALGFNILGPYACIVRPEGH